MCQHIVENEEVEGMVDGWASVVADRGVNVGEGVINVRGRGWYDSGEVSLEGHSIVSIRGVLVGVSIVKSGPSYISAYLAHGSGD